MIAQHIFESMNAGSLIRQMFEEGARLKKEYGADQVFDFSLGNPDLEPPASVQDALKDLVLNAPAGSHGYMNNAGLPATRQAVADYYLKLSGLPVTAADVCMTVGAAGALNVMLKAILNPGDQVIVLAPFFFEYLSYITNHGGQPVIIPPAAGSLVPDLKALAEAINERTKAIIINSPNNPTGMILGPDVLTELDRLSKGQAQTIYVLSDEPYAQLVFSGETMPATFAYIDNAIICTSWSKSLSLPGERIGSVVVSPRCQAREQLSQAAAYCNRILGFVNAPALFQRLIERSVAAVVDIAQYEKRRDRLYQLLCQAGFQVEKPAAGLYLFAKSPIDDLEFAAFCANHRVLLVPGSAFYCPGYVRLCFAVSEQTLNGVGPALLAIGRAFNLI